MASVSSASEEVNEKHIVATSHLWTLFSSKASIKTDKVFGLLVKATNMILKFRLMVDHWHSSNMRNDNHVLDFKLIYLGDDDIDFKIKIFEKTEGVIDIEGVKNMSFYNKQIELKSPSSGKFGYFLLHILLEIKLHLRT